MELLQTSSIHSSNIMECIILQLQCLHFYHLCHLVICFYVYFWSLSKFHQRNHKKSYVSIE